MGCYRTDAAGRAQKENEMQHDNVITVSSGPDNRISVLIRNNGSKTQEVLLGPVEAGQLARNLWEISQSTEFVEAQVDVCLRRNYGTA